MTVLSRHRRVCAFLALSVAAALLIGGCSAEDGRAPAAEAAGSAFGDPGPAGPSWQPAPDRHGALASVATAGSRGFRLHTASGDKTFVPGINLGSTTPTHQPGELAMTAADYRRWFAQLGELGVRAVRIYTIHPPAFYDELASYNREHAAAPLYLAQGVYLPDESYTEPDRTLYSTPVDDGLSREIADASAAVHGDLTRARRPGFASGTWRTDVSQWVMSWIVGVEWDPAGTLRTDTRERGAAYTPGRYFAATPGATATERWLARHLDELAGLEHGRGSAPPIAFANWPTTDPLAHPDEPLAAEDLVGVDANHVLPTRAWPGGTFASFHVYPYYPDFLRHERALRRTRWHGRPDPYAGYLAALRRHFASMPVLVTEFGVPASLGSAHRGPNGRGQGDHGEAQAMAADADLMRLLEAQGMGAGFVFAWSDEWFKRSWNTLAHQVPAGRRQLWHDPLTNEQWFGVLATDSAPVADSLREQSSSPGPVRRVRAEADASYLNLTVTYRTAVPDRLTIGSDTVTGAGVEDYRIVLDLAGHTGQAWVRAGLDPIRLDTDETDYQPDAGRPWHRYRMIVNRGLRVHGRSLPAEFSEVGRLREGTWDPEAEAYDSRSTWQVTGNTVRVRLPWALLGLSDPSSRSALGEGRPARVQRIAGLRLGLAADGVSTPFDYGWPTWNHVRHTERVKQGADVLARAFRETG